MSAATVAPLRVLRFELDRVGDLGAVWAPPYDVVTPEAAARLRRKHPNNIVRLTNPEGEPPERHTEAAGILKSWIAEGTLVRDVRPAFLVHRHSFNLGGVARTRTGVWALLKLTPFGAGPVLPHERTMSGPKADRLALMRACNAQLSPVFFICSDADGGIGKLLRAMASGVPMGRTEFPAGEAHEIWKVDEAPLIEELAAAMGKQLFLIADGHHRYETALAYRDGLIHAGAPHTGRHAHEFVLAYVVPEDDPGLLLLPTHRLITGEPLDWMGAVLKASGSFEVMRLADDDLESIGQRLNKEAGEPCFALVARNLEGGWLLRLRKAGVLSSIPSVAFHDVFMAGDVGLRMDVQIARTTFVKDADEAVRRVRSGSAEAAAVLAAPLVSQVREAAAAGERMPPKTTFFWPKVPTGVAVHLALPDEEVGVS